MYTVKLILIGIGSFLLFRGYNLDVPPGPGPTPVPVVVPVTPVEVFPDAPNSSSQETLKALDTVVTDKADALILGRACRDWAGILGRDTAIIDLSQFDAIRVNSFRELLSGTPMVGKYGGKVNDVMKTLYIQMLAGQKDANGDVQTAVTPQVRLILVNYLNALSWKFSSIALSK